MNNLSAHFSRSSLVLALASLLPLLSGCSALRSDYQTPNVTLPAVWQQAATSQVVAPQLATLWWQAFNDPQLDALIEEFNAEAAR